MGIIKNVTKQAISRMIGKGICKKDYKRFDSNEVVSFDVFDTLVLRRCENPHDVFELVENQYNKNNIEKIKNFKTLRISVEKELRTKNNGKEVKFNEIYESLVNRLGLQVASKLKELELEIELSVCYPNKNMVDLYNYLINKGKRVFIISDMYLSKTVIQKILENCGINGYEKLYVSSENGMTKRSGELFELVIKENDISANQMIHVGDHPIADWHMPKKIGMDSFLYKQKNDNIKFSFRKKLNKSEKYTRFEDVQIDILKNCIDRTSNTLNYQVGNQVLGPMLYGFSTWLHQWVEENKISDICFLSREGLIMKNFYEALYSDENVKTHYINVSRMSVCRANVIETKTYQELISLFSSLMRGINSVGELVDLIGLNKYKDDILNKCHVKANDLLDGIDTNMLYEAIKILGKEYFENQNKFIRQYLKGLIGNTEKIALVDIGWSGTMQIYLQKLMPEKRIVGNYIAVSSMHTSYEYTSLKRRGYWCNADEWDNKGRAIRFSQSAIEALFMSDEGSTLEYKLDNGIVEPIKEENEINSDFKTHVIEVSNGAINFAKTCKNSNIQNIIGYVRNDIAMLPYIGFAVYPSVDTIKFFEKLNFLDGIRVVNFLPYHKSLYYLVHYIDAKKELEYNACKIIWLKGLFKINFPYYKILCFLTGNMGMKSAYKKKVEEIEG